MHDADGAEKAPTSLQDYRSFRVALEARVEIGSAFAADVERLKREYLGVTPIGDSANEPSQRQARLRNLRRARVTVALTREALLVS